MLKQELKGIFCIREQTEEFKIITLYRFISLISISVFFFVGNVKLPIISKAFIITCIGLSSIILNYLYQKNRDMLGNIKVLILIEIIGNSLILVPTGGLNSPYVWYSINTILIAAAMLESLYCWINLSVYIFTSTCMVYLIFYNGELKLTEFVSDESNLILSLVLITAIIRQLAIYIKRLRAEGTKQIGINRQLNAANRKVRESVDHIMELYQTVYMFTTLHDKEDIISTILEYTGKVTKAGTVFFYSLADNGKRIVLRTDSQTNDVENILSQKIAESLDKIMNSTVPPIVNVDDKSFLTASFRSNCITYGVLGVEITRDQPDECRIDFIDQLKFMAGLSSIVFEKFEMEKVNERLVITEEQNRIANEIHDSVLQRLFSTSFGMHGLMKNIGSLADNEINEELNLIRNSINSAMKELRTAIYSMSFNKGGIDNFISDTKKFIDETRRLNNISINFKYTGNSESLTLLQKKSLYRIICEGVGNAIRHGSSKYIEVILQVQENVLVLKITDDGTGFDLRSVKQFSKGGLGIKNIEALVRYLNGKVCIRSSIGKGTRISITCPIYTHMHEEEKIV